MARLLLFGKALIMAFMVMTVILLWPFILFIAGITLLVTIFYQSSLYEAKQKKDDNEEE